MDCGIISLRFNPDQSMFIACMERGIKIFNVEPLVLQCHLETRPYGTASQCYIYSRSNAIMYIPGGSKPKLGKNHAIFYCKDQDKVVGELKFSSDVVAVRMTHNRCLVAQETQLHIFTFPDRMKFLITLPTIQNRKGLLEVSASRMSEYQIAVFPGFKTGSIQILDLNNIESSTSSAPVFIAAHENPIACIAMDLQATKIATASNKGTLIRIWDTRTRNQLLELRRGTDPASIYCINISPNSEFLCCSSDKGTVHIFAIKETHFNKRMGNTLRMIGGQYGESQWAFANFTLRSERPCVCGFGEQKSVFAICMDGGIHKYVFNPDNGSCSREEYEVFYHHDIEK
ncbi:WD repeat domain phosphoinositide-interacting protein 4-like [Onthophagus taurus]|uniref:WD repeat domain phosphoinositide-interacting protein 4-like n=1 Tax=Onthophagus taurus TaxID=166361 RepID=UPI000C1FF217|nr:WD repeat domain phosphoinositide-interacting protein 4-like [Onthophagus taurus]